MDERGSTLLELLLICLLLTLLAGLSLPVVRVTERMRLEREASFLASDFRYLQEISRTVRTPSGEGFDEWQARPKLIVEAHRYYFHFQGKKEAVLQHDFPPDIVAVPRTNSYEPTTLYFFHPSGDPGGRHTIGCCIELVSPHYSLDVIIDEAGRVRTERR